MKELLNKYLAGETSLEEEDTLKRFYAAHPELAESAYFGDLEQYRTAQAQVAAPVRSSSRRALRLRIGSVAAAAALLTFVLFLKPLRPEAATDNDRKYVSEVLISEDLKGEITDEQQAIEQTEKALVFLSRKMNKGLRGMQKIKKFQEEVERIEPSDKPKNKNNEK